MLRTPLWIPAALFAFLSFGGTAHAANAFPALPERAIAPPIEQVRFEARRGKPHRGARHPRRGRAAGCRRCHRRGTVALLASPRREKIQQQVPPAPPQPSTFWLRKDVLGPLRVRLYSSTWAESCEAKHPTFVARTGSYLADDGARKRCE